MLIGGATGGRLGKLGALTARVNNRSIDYTSTETTKGWGGRVRCAVQLFGCSVLATDVIKEDIASQASPRSSFRSSEVLLALVV